MPSKSPGSQSGGRLLILLIAGLAGRPLSAAESPAARAACDAHQPIARIEIERINVFDARRPEFDRGGFRVANAIHRPMLTRERTIRSLLTIRRGRACSIDDLEEAERDLRARPFLQDAWVEAAAVDQGGVVVRVRVQDAWSTRPGLSYRSEGGQTTTRLHIREVNLLGTGSRLEWSRRSDQDRTESSLRYFDPSLHGSHWRSELIYSDNSDGRQRHLALDRPFWKLDARWALRLEGGDEQRIDKVYLGGEEIDRWRVDSSGGAVAWGRAPHGLVGDRLFRWGLKVGFDRQRWSNARRLAPARPEWRPYDRDLLLGGGSLEWQRIDIRRVQYYDSAKRVEDLHLGRRIGVAAATSLPGSTDSGGRLAAWWREGYGLPHGGFLVVEGRHESERLRGGLVNAVTSVESRYLLKLSPLQTVVVEARADFGESLEGPRRLLLGGERGLRGYRSRAFSGDRRLRLGLEHRFFAPWELWNLFRVGLVGFFEAGGAWDDGDGLGWDRIHPDVGVGARLLILPSSTGTTLHFNLALPLDPNAEPGGSGGLRFSFLTATTF